MTFSLVSSPSDGTCVLIYAASELLFAYNTVFFPEQFVSGTIINRRGVNNRNLFSPRHELSFIPPLAKHFKC